MPENDQALSYVENCIRELNNHFNVSSSYQPFTYFVTVSLGDHEQTIKFPKSLIDDFELAFEKHPGTSYFGTLESSIKFSIYLELGSAGLLSDFEVSREIVSEQRDWVKKYPIDVFFDERLTEILHAGLRDLDRFFERLLKDHGDLTLTEVQEHKEWVETLLNYYDKEGTLDSPGVGLRNLQYLKAGALSQIRDLEKRRRNETKPIVNRALNEQIYFIVSELRKDPFLETRLPDFANDLMAE